MKREETSILRSLEYSGYLSLFTGIEIEKPYFGCMSNVKSHFKRLVRLVLLNPIYRDNEDLYFNNKIDLYSNKLEEEYNKIISIINKRDYWYELNKTLVENSNEYLLFINALKEYDCLDSDSHFVINGSELSIKLGLLEGVTKEELKQELSQYLAEVAE